MKTPVFAVVGRPNKGKSSIVATLARDDSVHISPMSGTTRKARRFPMSVNDELLYELVDTPGIQRARELLAWLREHNTDAASRASTVKQFVEEHANDPHFKDECEALKTIVEGAGVIYVVDGSCPFGADYEAEMEILRWAGRPSLALINPIENDDYVDAWSAGLGQYFHTVRSFDAHRAEIHKQFGLLELFGHLDPDWRASLQHAVRVLREERHRQHEQAAAEMTALIMDSIDYKVEQSIVDGIPEKLAHQQLFMRYKSHLVRREQQCRKRVEELFEYSHLQKTEQKLAFDEAELFDEENWYLWGLNKWQMIVAASAAGGLVGAGAGMAVAAASGGVLFAAPVIGAASGAVASLTGAWAYSDNIARFKVKGLPTGGKLLSVGPSKNINFPFVLLGRALLHHQLVSTRTHAAQGKLDLDQPLLEWMSSQERNALTHWFADIKAGNKLARRRAQLEDLILARCLSVDEK